MTVDIPPKTPKTPKFALAFREKKNAKDVLRQMQSRTVPIKRGPHEGHAVKIRPIL